jgi:hypothetical protein
MYREVVGAGLFLRLRWSDGDTSLASLQILERDPEKACPHLMRGGSRFPASAKPSVRFNVRLGPLPGAAKSEKIIAPRKS